MILVINFSSILVLNLYKRKGRFMKKLFFMALVGILTTSSYAETSKKMSCMKIEEACRQAGYSRGHSKEHKNIQKDCMKPILGGKTVEGVTVEQTDIDNCKLRAKAIAKKKKEFNQDAVEKRIESKSAN